MDIKAYDNSITMKAGDADKWLSALRSGKYKQGYGLLSDEKTKCFCALGVLTIALDGKVLKGKVPTADGRWNDYSLGFIPSDWYEERDIKINNAFIVGEVDGSSISLYHLNDGLKLSFNQIADILEKCIEKV